MAPEMMELELQRPLQLLEGYTYMVDYWSLGVVMYVMLTGHFPFRLHKGRDGTARDLNVRREGPIEFQEGHLSLDCIDFICSLLDINEKERLGYGVNGLEDIKNHPYYQNCKSFDWSNVMKKACRPPVVPSEIYDYSIPSVPKKFQDLLLLSNDGTPFPTPDGWDQECFKDWYVVCCLLII
jgi:serine/threonine protein kinase